MDAGQLVSITNHGGKRHGAGRPKGSVAASRAATTSTLDRLAIARAEREEYQAQIVKLELAALRQQSISKKKLGPALAAEKTRFKARLRSIPSKWVAQFVPPSKMQQAEAALRKAIDEALAELSGGEA